MKNWKIPIIATVGGFLVALIPDFYYIVGTNEEVPLHGLISLLSFAAVFFVLGLLRFRTAQFPWWAGYSTCGLILGLLLAFYL